MKNIENELISVIMSVYNENNAELKKSIGSILNQSYRNLEVIIVNDNPKNIEIESFFNEISDTRVKIINNKKNEGLVFSLNRALEVVSGKYVARMDADDISELDRIEKEYIFLKDNNLDFVGTWVELIDEQDNVTGSMKFITSPRGIKHQIRFGGCVAHPTWLVKTEVYKTLNGYRDIPCCEDYDFLLRTLNEGYKIGNLNYIGLKYRVRKEGISISNKNRQLVVRRYLAHNAKKINKIAIKDVEDFVNSEAYINKIKEMDRYERSKQRIKDRKVIYILYILFNKNLYLYLEEKLLSDIIKIWYE